LSVPPRSSVFFSYFSRKRVGVGPSFSFVLVITSPGRAAHVETVFFFFFFFFFFLRLLFPPPPPFPLPGGESDRSVVLTFFLFPLCFRGLDPSNRRRWPFSPPPLFPTNHHMDKSMMRNFTNDLLQGVSPPLFFSSSRKADTP